MKYSDKITIIVPSFNQDKFIDKALDSIFSQNVELEVFVMDGASTDNSIQIINHYDSKLDGWRSRKDNGQSEAINEGIKKGDGKYVMWLNSDDILLDHGLERLKTKLELSPSAPFVYAQSHNIDPKGNFISKSLTLPFNRCLFANYCFISQPATLIRRKCWESIGGLDETLDMAMDYDMWWRLINQFGPPKYLKTPCAANRIHGDTKTQTRLNDHYAESINVVEKHYGRVPLKWYLLKPVMQIIRFIQNQRL